MQILVLMVNSIAQLLPNRFAQNCDLLQSQKNKIHGYEQTTSQRRLTMGQAIQVGNSQ